jgi:hypothetical protein
MFRLFGMLFGRRNRRAWWRRFPGGGSRLPQPPQPEDRPDPRLQPGTLVRFRGKPDRLRRVLKSEWHGHRQQFVYIVETSARPAFQPYWFAEQLEVVGEGADA